jgi:hypothetical protein
MFVIPAPWEAEILPRPAQAKASKTSSQLINWVWWIVPVIPALEIIGSSIIVLGKNVRPCLKNS